MKIVISILGEDQIGIVAAVATILAAHKVNILDIDQGITHGLFNMVMIADMEKATVELGTLQDILKAKGEEMGLQIKAQNVDIFKSMHRV